MYKNRKKLLSCCAGIATLLVLSMAATAQQPVDVRLQEYTDCLSNYRANQSERKADKVGEMFARCQHIRKKLEKDEEASRYLPDLEAYARDHFEDK